MQEQDETGHAGLTNQAAEGSPATPANTYDNTAYSIDALADGETDYVFVTGERMRFSGVDADQDAGVKSCVIQLLPTGETENAIDGPVIRSIGDVHYTRLKAACLSRPGGQETFDRLEIDAELSAGASAGAMAGSAETTSTAAAGSAGSAASSGGAGIAGLPLGSLGALSANGVGGQSTKSEPTGAGVLSATTDDGSVIHTAPADQVEHMRFIATAWAYVKRDFDIGEHAMAMVLEKLIH